MRIPIAAVVLTTMTLAAHAQTPEGTVAIGPGRSTRSRRVRSSSAAR